MDVYQTNRDGFFLGVTTADESPLEPGVFHIPSGCVTEPPPPVDEGQRARFAGGAWSVEAIPNDPEPETNEPAPAPLTRLHKAVLWRRLTEAEADMLDAALAAHPSTRLRRIFEAAQYLDTGDADYPALRDGVVAALGETRAAEVLAPDR